MTLKEIFKLKLKYYNFGEVFSEVSFEFDHYPTEKEMLDTVREYESKVKTMYELRLSVEKIHQVKR